MVRVEFTRSQSVAALNALLNHPDIYPNMGADGYLDGSPLLADGFLYLCDHGGMLFHGTGRALECHYLFLASLRGGEAQKMALGMVHACVLENPSRILWGRVSLENRAARLFSRKLGFVSLSICDAPLPVEIFVWGGASCRSLGKSSGP